MSPAGTWVPERQLERRDVYEQWMPVWRAGVVYDLFGDGRTAIKGNYSRYGFQVGIDHVTQIHPFTLTLANIPWSDLNGDDFPQTGELGTFEGFAGAATTRYADADGPDWGYSDEITAGIEHQLLGDIRVGAMYHHRTNRKNIGFRNAAVPPDAYVPTEIADPLGGGTLTFYNLDPEFLGLQDNVRENIPLLDTDYDGIEVTAAKRFADRWQLLFGYTFGTNEGGIDLGDFNDPNNLINQQGKVANDSTHSFKVAGTWVIPRAEISLSSSLVRNTGYPRQPTYQINREIYPDLTRSTQNLRLLPRGELRVPDVTMIDLRISRPFRFGTTTLEPQLDIFNATNADTIVGVVDQIGSRYGFPTEILAPRLVRVGLVIRF
ncbi:MAG: hypothetical protein GEV06_12405 [Luteitalea sp.]|nr:hypothetical protein [Luteitalea sp.]